MRISKLVILGVGMVCVGLFALVMALMAAEANEPNDHTKTVATNTVPELLGNSDRIYKTIIFHGMKAARTNNTGTVWLQRRAANDSPGTPLLAGQIISVSIEGMTLSHFWIDVETPGDGVTCTLFE